MSFKPYPKYKDSGVEWLGKVPEGWEVKPLKHLAGIDSCGCYGMDPEEGGEVLRVATTAQIDPSGRFDVDRMPERGFSAAEVSRYGCSAGDILVVKSSGSATNIISGKAGLVDEATPKFIFSNFLMRVRPLVGAADPRFIYALLRSNLTRQRVELMCSTTTYPNLQIGEYVSAPLPVPPVEEQSSIASFLDHETSKIDNLIKEQEKLIELLKEKRSAVISHAVTKGLDDNVKMKDSGVEWLGEVPEHWEVWKISHAFRLIGSGTTPKSDNPEYYEGGEVPWVNTGDLNDGDLVDCEKRVTELAVSHHSSLKIYPSETLLIAMYGATTGKLGILKFPATVNQACCAFSNGHAIEVKFLFYWLRGYRAQVLSLAYGGGQPNVSQEVLRELRVACPTTSEQREIASFLDHQKSKIDGLIREAESAINLLQERRSALISAAVTGQIDVRDWNN